MPGFFFPNYELKTRNESNKTLVYDELRKKWIILTPEENVRQHLWIYLNKEFNYPKSLITIEKKIIVNQLEKRFDLLVYNKEGNPIMIVECKSPKIGLNQNTIEQVLRYNIRLKARYLLITNGIDLYCAELNLKNGEMVYLKSIPFYNDIS